MYPNVATTLAEILKRYRKKSRLLESPTSSEPDETFEANEGLRVLQSNLAWHASTFPANSMAELAVQAEILQDWLDRERDDIPTALALALCRNILRLAAAKAGTALPSPSALLDDEARSQRKANDR